MLLTFHITLTLSELSAEQIICKLPELTRMKAELIYHTQR